MTKRPLAKRFAIRAEPQTSKSRNFHTEEENGISAENAFKVGAAAEDPRRAGKIANNANEKAGDAAARIRLAFGGSAAFGAGYIFTNHSVWNSKEKAVCYSKKKETIENKSDDEMANQN